jgi:uncharacterized membrane protein YfcA
MLVLAAALSLAIGVILGMLGGGGAILTLPMLVYAVGVEPKAAIATSLFVVGATSIAGSTVHARAGAVRWKVGGIFGLAAMAGAYAGGRVAYLVPGSVLLVLFGALMVVTATAMLKGRSAGAREPEALRLSRALALGAAVGVMSGLVGAGGGFLIVPALTLFGGLAIREAIGTSLLVIALQSFAGFAGHITHVHLDWTLVLVIAATSLAGSVLGAVLGAKVSPHGLRRGFAWLVLAMGLFMFFKQLPALYAAVAAALTLASVFYVTRVAGRSSTPLVTDSPLQPVHRPISRS